MSKTVYVLGAGVNQSIKDNKGASPPLNSNFFQVAEKKGWFSREKNMPDWMKILSPILKFIWNYWKIDEDDLATKDFDFEGLFTFIESQLADAENENEKQQLEEITSKLRSFVFQLLTRLEFEPSGYFDHKTENFIRTFSDFAECIWKEQATIITFNYDTFLEHAIHLVSGWNLETMKDISQKMRTTGPPQMMMQAEDYLFDHNWLSALAYGVNKFDLVQTENAGVRSLVDGKKFYELHKKMEDLTILKMHGSVNWLRYTGDREGPFFPGDLVTSLSSSDMKKVFLIEEYFHPMSVPNLDGWIVDPIIVPPTLFKEKYFEHELFKPIWQRAREELSVCENLIIIGYSFPQTDFKTTKLFLEAFRDHNPKTLTVVNPNSSVVQKAKELTHFKEPISWCKNLEEYVLPFKREEASRREESLGKIP